MVKQNPELKVASPRQELHERWLSILKAGIFIAAILIIYLREPSFFIEPRFWAEEGSHYFPRAYHVTWYESLITLKRGYFSFWPNLAATVAANLVAVRHGPLVTTLFAFFVQISALSIIVWSKSAIWGGITRKIIAILIVLLAPLSGEVWLNTINSQFYFSLITFLILHETVETLGFYKSVWYRILLVVAGMTGTVSCFMTPLFLMKSWIEKKRERLIQSAILVLCSTIHLLILWRSVSNNLIFGRSASIEWPTLFSIIWTQSLGLLFLGLENARAFSSLIHEAYQLPGREFELLAFLLLGVEVLIFLYLASGVDRQKRFTLLGSYFLILILSTLGGQSHDKFSFVSPGNAGRYYYVPNVILLLVVLCNIKWNKDSGKKIRSTLCIILLTVSLSLGAFQYTTTLIRGENWAQWRDEVSKWEKDPEYNLEIWPPGWKMQLGEPRK